MNSPKFLALSFIELLLNKFCIFFTKLFKSPLVSNNSDIFFILSLFSERSFKALNALFNLQSISSIPSFFFASFKYISKSILPSIKFSVLFINSEILSFVLLFTIFSRLRLILFIESFISFNIASYTLLAETVVSLFKEILSFVLLFTFFSRLILILFIESFISFNIASYVLLTETVILLFKDSLISFNMSLFDIVYDIKEFFLISVVGFKDSLISLIKW